MKRPTIDDVARQSGFSLSTVSLVINDRGYVSAETRRKILEVVGRLGYHPTRSARGLASRTSGNVGFILTEDHFSQAEPFYTRIFLGTEFESRNFHYYILLTTVPSVGSHIETPRFLLERHVDGVIIAGKVSHKLIEHVESFGVPIILVDYEVKRRRYSAVLIDNRAGAHLAVRHLLATGRSAIGFLGGDIDHPSIAERLEGYREVIAESGKEELISTAETETRSANGFSAMQDLWNRGVRPDAVFAANDAMAIGGMQFLKQQGVRIPEDIALIGFDDIDTCRVMDPPLSSIRVFKEEMGRIAVQRLVDMITAKTTTVVTTHVPVELVVRASSAPIEVDVGAPGQPSLQA